MIKKLSKFISILFLAIIFFVIVFLLYFSFQSKKHPEKVPTLFGISPLTVLTNSMHPFIKAGDLVFIKKVEPSEVKVNDVITFKETPTKFITHRVTAIKKNKGTIGFVTKGDNNNVADSKIVASNQLIGSLQLKIPKAGYFSKFVSGPIGFILLILIPATGYICLEVYERLSKQKKKQTPDTL
ncbi:signal peptidase I [Heyndrickxia sporothermodurans]|uniref:Signal peptidase I n=1 Tax=Heyndrickxia sporothermodurans TaxID=46224 RepID=A0AB37HB91_9BACI|nr:signal peptidase I [Heyndrickxia sporothermodurans]MBL5782726.1 signal peptidase I [Heyndrickxia sporothermodurans]MBL5854345.1 signal peptidase I [Heyndrickxia sporothermodurans]MBL7247981.1 signal peptidase I [Heyndrickxia sporothermodurans]MEB6549382.1 signal peptidase I [Heyndrickxia sporothermodurans]MED3651277.1 signal peptidase I [Heyndrickxia sporothermodurans]